MARRCRAVDKRSRLLVVAAIVRHKQKLGHGHSETSYPLLPAKNVSHTLMHDVAAPLSLLLVNSSSVHKKLKFGAVQQ